MERLGAGNEINMSSALTIDDAQMAAVVDKTLSLYVWGRVEYTDETQQPRHLSFRGIINGPPDTVVVDGVRARGWGFNATKDGFEAN